jgi:hypothetical protein
LFGVLLGSFFKAASSRLIFTFDERPAKGLETKPEKRELHATLSQVKELMTALVTSSVNVRCRSPLLSGIYD